MGMPRDAARPAVGLQVGLHRDRGAVFDDAVHEELDAAGRQAVGRGRLAPLDQLADLLKAPLVVPQQGQPHARCQPARPLHGGVRRLPFRPDDGVLPAGDAQRVELALPLPQPGLQIGLAGGRHVVRHQVDGALLQHAGRRAVRIALDPAVRRVRRWRSPGRQAAARRS